MVVEVMLVLTVVTAVLVVPVGGGSVEEDVVDVEIGSLQSVLNKSAVRSVQLRGMSCSP